MGLTNDLAHFVLSVDFKYPGRLDSDVINMCHLALTKLCMISSFNIDLVERIDLAGNWRDALCRFLKHVRGKFLLDGCDIFWFGNASRKEPIATCGTSACFQIPERMRSARTSIKASGLDIGKFSSKTGSAFIQLRFGSVPTKLRLRCLFKEDLPEKILWESLTEIDFLLQNFVLSQSNINRTPLFEVGFHEDIRSEYSSWIPEVSVRAEF